MGAVWLRECGTRDSSMTSSRCRIGTAVFVDGVSGAQKVRPYAQEMS